MWVGKLIGGMWGLISGGPYGIIVGVILGHLLDVYLAKQKFEKEKIQIVGNEERGQIQQFFFRATFRFMGRLAKADGRVTEQEISAATRVMDQMAMGNAQRQLAIKYFTEGKDPNSEIEGDLMLLKDRPDLAQIFLEIQLSVAYADGKLSYEERKLFDRLCKMLRISPFHFEWINSRVQAVAMGPQFRQQQSQQQSQHQRHQSSDYHKQEEYRSNNDPQLRNAYAVLGVRGSVSNEELKKAYRKLMSQHHPDKLVAKGLPEEMMKIAKEKTQQIQTAYDYIAKARRGVN